MFVSSELWCPNKMRDIACAAVILHNMKVEKRRDSYNGDGVRQNKSTAKELFGKSCDYGDADGCKNYKMLNEEGIN